MKRLCFGLLICIAFISHANAQTASVRLEGQVVCCEDCWAEHDRTRVEFGTAEDLLKAQECTEHGDPTLIAVREGDKFTLYQLEEGKFRVPEKNWLGFVGKHVAVTGTVRKVKKTNLFRVDELQVLKASLAEQEAANVLGKEVELALKDPFETEQRLSSLRGRIVVLNFWATYCIPCRKEMPDLAAIQNEYAAFGVQVIGATADTPDERAKVMQFVKEVRINFPVWMGATTADMIRFGLGPALPGTVIIGKDGRVAKVISGIINPVDLKKQIQSMLKAAEATAATTRNGEREQTASSKIRKSEASSVPS